MQQLYITFEYYIAAVFFMNGIHQLLPDWLQ